ncbi:MULTISPECIES: amidohydrolase family protein [Pseudonocardia]|uniref:Amidohydrolase n=2 Tax=Pseudonocardia TaxID=1847 RepID=A0A1Y2MZ86_PSEAH|nr:MULTISPECIES: amidohydrolase family protein [Pseudonocardia]OSY40371.1 Amidohydrolase [Pseudonocardia autotrophica]TDN72298.1 4-oxalmesaconate hydratase [Pseudonocardia autotrophica]BBG03010.1 4-oxalomesaconate hydratase [Pseudonocardia autotrophica]GEC25088.1 4-oxalomesaconate hydratase [Pseudonocardia saturnea]
MKIDVHGHLSAPESLYAYKAGLLAHRGAHGRGGAGVTDETLRAALTTPNKSFGNRSHLDHLDEAGVDVQLISPRPYQMMHSEQGRLVEWFTAETNDVIAATCRLEPDRFRGVAGLPQSPELDPARWAAELHRCVTELGFVGGMLNPDPHEGSAQPPALGDRYWYPVWEAACALDVPLLIHSAGCRPPARETYSLHFIQEETLAVIGLLNSAVFDDFPDLKIIVSHGGGAIPYQRGRFGPGALRKGTTFAEQLRKLHYDTCLYSRDSIELLLRAVGVDRCLFGTEKPGTGSMVDPETGRWIDDIHLLIDDIDWLGDGERKQLFESNARELFRI